MERNTFIYLSYILLSKAKYNQTLNVLITISIWFCSEKGEHLCPQTFIRGKILYELFSFSLVLWILSCRQLTCLQPSKQRNGTCTYEVSDKLLYDYLVRHQKYSSFCFIRLLFSPYVKTICKFVKMCTNEILWSSQR